MCGRPPRRAAAAEEGELDQEGQADHLAAEALDELGGRRCGAPGGDDVVDHEHPLARRDGIGVHLEVVGPVLEGVLLRTGLAGQLAHLAERDEARPQRPGHGRGQHEATGLDPGHQVDRLLRERSGEGVDRCREGLAGAEQRGDVLEGHPRLREVRDVPHEPRQPGGDVGTAGGRWARRRWAGAGHRATVPSALSRLR
jgi:hypothetical protein